MSDQDKELGSLLLALREKNTTQAPGHTVGLLGQMGSGKDFIGDVLVETMDYTKLAFADPLKDEYCETLGITREELEENKADHRTGMQQLGHGRRENDDYYWIRKWLKARLAINTPVVCTDCRYINEATSLLTGLVFVMKVRVPEATRIERLVKKYGKHDPDWDKHKSETELHEAPFSAPISGDLPAQAVAEVVVQSAMLWRVNAHASVTSAHCKATLEYVDYHARLIQEAVTEEQRA